MGPWPLFCDYTILTLETKYSISFIEVGLRKQKLLNKMKATETRSVHSTNAIRYMIMLLLAIITNLASVQMLLVNGVE